MYGKTLMTFIVEVILYLLSQESKINRTLVVKIALKYQSNFRISTFFLAFYVTLMRLCFQHQGIFQHGKKTKPPVINVNHVHNGTLVLLLLL